jgi:hypothetical protein
MPWTQSTCSKDTTPVTVDPATKRPSGENKRDKTSQSGMSQMLKEFMKKASYVSRSRMTIGAATMQDLLFLNVPSTMHHISHTLAGPSGTRMMAHICQSVD